ncbi:hypothetical protein OXV74_04160 [Bacteroides thetaiotaomicron]|nr:hypothetical protein [Bacteroides thetaiotaomicron]
MNDSTCPRPCLMKLDLQSSTNKLAFLKDNWPSFGQIESIDRLSETELRCTLCLLDVVLAALAKDECFCPNREIIRLVLTRTYVQNRCELCETEEIRSKLVKGFCTREKKNGLSRKNNIRRRGISVFMVPYCVCYLYSPPSGRRRIEILPTFSQPHRKLR